MTPAALAAAKLRALAERATPGQRMQMSGKYISFDYGETPQVFRQITAADEALILACSPEAIIALCDAVLSTKEVMPNDVPDMRTPAMPMQREGNAVAGAAHPNHADAEADRRALVEMAVRAGIKDADDADRAYQVGVPRKPSAISDIATRVLASWEGRVKG